MSHTNQKLAGTVYNDKEGQAETMAELALALVTGEGMEKIEFENERYIYMPYAKVTQREAENLLKRKRGQ